MSPQHYFHWEEEKEKGSGPSLHGKCFGLVGHKVNLASKTLKFSIQSWG